MSFILMVALLLQGARVPRQTNEIRGTVVDSMGKPVSKAAIEAVGWEGEISGKTVRLISGDNGSFSLQHLDCGKYRLYAWKDSIGVPETRALIFEGSAQLYSEVTVEAEVQLPPVILKLPPAYGKISGHIVDAASQLPIARVRIRLERRGQPEIMYETSAEADGSYVLRLPARPIRIIISAPGYAPWVYHAPDGQDSVILETGKALTMNVGLFRSNS